jgi:hypothetical protein
MIRLLHIASVAALVAAGSLLGSCIQQWLAGKQPHETLWDSPGAVQMFRENRGGLKSDDGDKTPPLVKQAEALAAYLAPAQLAKKVETPVTGQATTMPTPPIRPVAASAKFKLVGTSYYPNQPKRSMALISEPDLGAGGERWVKEGTQVEHFVIHEIRHGLIVYRDGDNLREMAVEPGMSAPSLVQDTRLGVRKVSAAVDGIGTLAPVGNGPNSIEIAAGN